VERDPRGDLALNAPRRACVRGGLSKDDSTTGIARRAARARDDVLDLRGAVGVLVSRGAVTGLYIAHWTTQPASKNAVRPPWSSPNHKPEGSNRIELGVSFCSKVLCSHRVRTNQLAGRAYARSLQGSI